MHLVSLLTLLLIAINVYAFVLMWRDKRVSTRNSDAKRTPEGLIFFFATIGGSVGVYLGMQAFRHKTRRWYFQVGIPLLILQNAATLYLVWQLTVSS